MKDLFLTTLLSVFTLTCCNTPTKNTDHGNNGGASMNTPLQETHWKLIELNGQAVVNPVGNQKEAYIMLAKEGNRLSGSGGCNMMMGGYELLEGNQIRFTGVASTRMACPDMSIEDGLGKAISNTDHYVINGKYLMLHKANMAPLAKFEAQ